jgi:hypothetical protein
MKKLSIISMITAIFLIFSGCNQTESSERLYTKEIHIKNNSVDFIFFDDSNISIKSDDILYSLKQAENSLGKDIFTSHTNAVVLDCNNYQDTVSILRNKLEISDLCKISLDYDNKNQEFNLSEITKTCEENLTVPVLNISSVLDELLSPCKMALITDFSSDMPFSAIISDNSVITYLKGDALSGISFLHSNKKNANYQIDNSALEIKNAKRRFKVDFSENKLIISVFVSFDCDDDYMESAQEYFEKIINQAVDETLKNGYDVLGICNLIRQRNYNFYLKNQNNMSNCLKTADYFVYIN